MEEGLWSLEEDKPEYVGDYRGAAYRLQLQADRLRNGIFSKGRSDVMDLLIKDTQKAVILG